MTTDISQVLVAMTTYPGNFEHRMILHKVLRHFRWRNGWDIKLAVFSDGIMNDPVVHQHADYVIDRPGPSGIYEGELESVRRLAQFAKDNHYPVIMKTAGDIIMNRNDWVQRAVQYYDERGCRLLSTHWHNNDSGIVGTKFFICDTEFLHHTWPATRYTNEVEEAFSASIAQCFIPDDVLYLINSNTGEADEVEAELKDWCWEHGHRLSKFRQLDDCTPPLTRLLHKTFLYQWLRVHRDIKRSLARLNNGTR
jgi:hypothetical protein